MHKLSLGFRFALVGTSALGLAMVQPSAQAQTTLVDFDNTGLSDQQAVTNQIDGLSITNGSIGYEGGRRTGFISNRGDDLIRPGRLVPGASFSGGFLTTMTFASRQNLQIDFNSAVSNLSFTVADLEGKERLTASVFDAAGTLLGSQRLAGRNSFSDAIPDARDGSGILVSFGLTGISRLVLDPAKDSRPNAGIGYAIDNLEFETAQAVPEPVSMLGLLAVGALGAGSLRKRQQPG